MRKKPYTEMGISRIPCARCGKPSSQQWQVCALGNMFMGVCENCDIELNKVVLKFFKIKNSKNIMDKYTNQNRNAGDV